jgi:phage shock protein E
MLKKGLVCLLLLGSSLSAFAAEYWIDVRVPQQYQRKHIEGAINVPMVDLQSRMPMVAENKDDTIHLYCNSGRQSALAKEKLEQMGYLNVIDEGGINELLSK